MVQWLGLQASTAGNTSLIPGWGTKIPHAVQHSQKLEKKKKNIVTWITGLAMDLESKQILMVIFEVKVPFAILAK